MPLGAIKAHQIVADCLKVSQEVLCTHTLTCASTHTHAHSKPWGKTICACVLEREKDSERVSVTFGVRWESIPFEKKSWWSVEWFQPNQKELGRHRVFPEFPLWSKKRKKKGLSESKKNESNISRSISWHQSKSSFINIININYKLINSIFILYLFFNGSNIITCCKKFVFWDSSLNRCVFRLAG